MRSSSYASRSDGQALAFDEARRRQDRAAMRDSQHSVFHGLFGSVSALRLRRVHAFLPIADAWCSGPKGRATFKFAANYDGSWRFMAGVDLGYMVGDVETVFANDGSRSAAAPNTHDGFAQWFATYAARVRLRAYRVAPLMPDAPDGTRGVVLFPTPDAGDDCHVSEAITRGIRVRASAVYLPNSPSGYAYSIASYVSDDAPESCQLGQDTGTSTTASARRP